MSESREGRPRRLHRPMPANWWTKKRNYFVFMLREVSAVFIGLVAVATILQVQALKAGPGAYATFMETAANPVLVALAFISLGFALLHTITFFLLAGRILVIPMGEENVPPQAIVAGHFAAWAVLSGLFVVLVL